MQFCSLKSVTHRLPAEWEPQSGIQLTWPHAKTDWAYCLEDIIRTFIELVNAIARYELVLIVAPRPEEVTPYFSNPRIRVVACSSNDTWARDHGALTLVDNKGEVSLLNFHFNGWGKKFPASFDNAITSTLHEKGYLLGTLKDHNDFVLEGGAIESDGQGTILTTSQCLLAPNRNQPLTRKQIEEELKRRLYAKHVVWFDHGNLEGDDTDGHIDTIVRMAPNNTLLYMGCDDTNDSQYEDLKALETQLTTVLNAEGEPFKLVKLPSPSAIFDENGERLPATYANFLIVNGAVIVPTYAQPEKDTRAQEVIRQVFPDREIIPLDARTIIRQHGSIHCLTMQYPIGVIANA